jgi:putative intracellular protease/amidase
LEYTLEAEAALIKELLEQSGFEIAVATVAGTPITAGSTTMTPDLKLSDVSVADYDGFILPCMAAGAAPPAPEAIEMVKEALAVGKPVATQFNATRTLAKAGVLEGKKYTFRQEVDVTEYPDFKGTSYAGSGVVQDGNIITSGVCPYAARAGDIQHGTEELCRMLAEAIKNKN